MLYISRFTVERKIIIKTKGLRSARSQITKFPFSPAPEGPVELSNGIPRDGYVDL